MGKKRVDEEEPARLENYGWHTFNIDDYVGSCADDDILERRWNTTDGLYWDTEVGESPADVF